jgi:2-polyprenyl-6-hydroxyphenyl methylase/3-demethylubiquinone-9 3-methyltransferase
VPINNRWYDRLGSERWDERGLVAALHEVNPVRVGYFIETLTRERPDASRVLDLGCGGGLVAEAVAAEGYAVTGLDASLPSLRAAREHGRSAAYCGGDALALPFADGSFDAVICSEVLEHVAHPDVLLRETVRVLMPGRLMLFSTPNRTWFARLGLIWVAELLRWAPRRTHVYSAFIRPVELALRMQRAGLTMREHRGIALRRPAALAMWGYLRSRELGGFRLSHDRRLQYIGWAEVPPG